MKGSGRSGLDDWNSTYQLHLTFKYVAYISTVLQHPRIIVLQSFKSTTGTTSTSQIFLEDIRHPALAPNFSVDPIFRKGDMESLFGALPLVSRTDSSFRDLLPSRPRRCKLKMWFQAPEFAASCTVAKNNFYRVFENSFF